MEQEEQQRTVYPSRFKYAAYLTVYMNQTEGSFVEKYLSAQQRGSGTYTLTVA